MSGFSRLHRILKDLLRKVRGGGSNGKIVAGVLANVVDKFSMILFQVLSLSTLPKHWGADQFGVWLVLTTVPTYIALAGFGFGSAAATDMTKKVAARDFSGALSDFQSVWIFISAATCMICGVGLVAWLTMKFGSAGRLIGFTSVDITIVILVIYSILAVQTGLFHAPYRATGRYALGTIFLDTIGTLERIGVIMTAILGGRFLLAAIAMLLIRLLGGMLFYAYIRLKQPWFKLGFQHARRETLRRLSKPALASLGLAASNAFSLQGSVTAIGLFISPANAAIFSSVRTMCRLPLQVSDLVGRATLPELTVAYAQGEYRRFIKLTSLNTVVAIMVVVPFLLVISVWGKDIGNVVSRGGLLFSDWRLFAVLGLATLFQSIWTACGQSLQAINRHHFFSFPYFFLALVPLACAFAKIDHGRGSILFVASSSAAVEFLTAAITIIYTWKQIDKVAIPALTD